MYRREKPKMRPATCFERCCMTAICIPCVCWSGFWRLALCPCTCGKSVGGNCCTEGSDACCMDAVFLGQVPKRATTPEPPEAEPPTQADPMARSQPLTDAAPPAPELALTPTDPGSAPRSSAASSQTAVGGAAARPPASHPIQIEFARQAMRDCEM